MVPSLGKGDSSVAWDLMVEKWASQCVMQRKQEKDIGLIETSNWAYLFCDDDNGIKITCKLSIPS